MIDPTRKYRPFQGIALPDREWPNRRIERAPLWCSVDLRDGNQALPVPMNVGQKMEMFEMLILSGFKQIEVGFPAASPTDYQFVRSLIESAKVPDDVAIQVLVQAREDLIAETIESLRGARRAIIHLYNSTSPAQRRIVFGLDKSGVAALAVRGAKWVREYAEALEGTEVTFQYSPESFSDTETEFALEVCEAVLDVWQPTPMRKAIINLPATVEMATPNTYADQIEWFRRHLRKPESVILSVHTHNDRGTGIAATELALLAGADRVEGTLFGNGERTGNADLITIALNLFTQGVDPKLELSDIDALRRVYERCTGMHVPDRHPYGGELVFTAFSGSHQDAIRKGLEANRKDEIWEVPYLSIDPRDIGRTYDKVIRVNGQSGKGGVGYILEKSCGILLPKEMLREFGAIAGPQIDALDREAGADDLKAMLWKEYVERDSPYRLLSFHHVDVGHGSRCDAVLGFEGRERPLSGEGNGPIDAFIHALHDYGIDSIEIKDQSEQALGSGSEASAIAYVQARLPDGTVRWGAGVDTNVVIASIRAIVSVLNRK